MSRDKSREDIGGVEVEKIGKFITIEGPDGAGKTTQVKKLKSYLQDMKKEVLVTREPGGTPLGEKLRKVLLFSYEDGPVDEAEALIYAASRAQLVKKVILPALLQDKIVLCDRFVDSSLAYQGFARNLGMEKILDINRWFLENSWPDITFVLNIDPKISLSRKKGQKDRLELENLDFHRRVQKGFLSLKERFPDRIKIIDANQKKEEIFNDILSELEKSGII